MKKLLSLVLALATLLSCAPALAEVPYYSVESDLYEQYPLDGEPIKLEIYSQLANYSGVQGGWSAALLKDLFNVEVTIIPDMDGTYDTRMINGNLGDIVVWGSNGEDYKQAVNAGMLLNWEDFDLGETYAPYVWENYGDALNNNREVSGDGNIYGYGFDVALGGGTSGFLYSWDLRWDLYKELGYPEIKDLDDLIDVFKAMKEICPTDEQGNPTYAASLWPDWDGNLVMYVKSTATAYYGYDEHGIGLYNPTNGEFYDALMEGGPYLEMLKFYNKLYREGLLDPNSMTQTYDEMGTKVKNGGVFWGIFNYASSMAYNTQEHLEAGKMMYSRAPDDATPINYGLSSLGGNRIWSVGAYTKYPELCLAILDFLSTPEGAMTGWYGPRGLTWDYDENGGMYFTELGKKTSADSSTDLNGVVWTSPYTGKEYTLSGSYNDGCLQANNTTLAKAMINPDGNGTETFDKSGWASEVAGATYDIEADWRAWATETLNSDMEIVLVDQYLRAREKYLVMPGVPYSESVKDDALKVKWGNVTKAIVNNSWLAIYAKNDGEFNFHIMNMRNQCKGYGYDECVQWSKDEAAIKWQMTLEQQELLGD